MSKIYLVTTGDGEEKKERLIKAHTKAGARNFAAKDAFKVDLASQDALVRLASSTTVEDATAESE